MPGIIKSKEGIIEIPIHTPETAPENAVKTLEKIEKGYGFLPNLMGVMANAPALLDSYTDLQNRFASTSLSEKERNVVWLAVSAENECHYCIPVHSATARKAGISDADIKAIQSEDILADEKLNRLAQYVRTVVRKNGRVTEDDVRPMYEQGYRQEQLLEILIGVAMKTISNYANRLAGTPVDAEFQ